MKRLLLVLVIAGAGLAAYWLQWSPHARAKHTCDRIETLCGSIADGCTEDLSQATVEEIAEVERCVEPADSCLETVGCLAGSAARELGEGAIRGLAR